MTSAISLEVKGLKEAQQNTERIMRELNGAPILNAMRDSTLLVQRDARKDAPVDTGRLRASILPEIRRVTDEVIGVVGSNVKYAPYVELGTRPHWPPLAALEVWARRHHTSAFAVALAISRRGTKARRYLQGAFEKNKDRIVKRFERAVSEVVK